MFSAVLDLSASQNPFELNQNMEQIDHEQERLLKELMQSTHENGASEKRQSGQKPAAKPLSGTPNQKQSRTKVSPRKKASQKRESASSPVKASPAKQTSATGISKKPTVRGPDRVSEVRKRIMTQEVAKAAEASSVAEEKMKQEQLAKERAVKEKNLEKKAAKEKSSKVPESVDSTALPEDEKKAAEEALRKAIMEVEAAGH